MNKILVIGSTNIDMIACVKHLPRPGETVGEARFMQSNGGKGANQAVAAARLGGDVAFVSCLGDDAGAAALRQQFAADGINSEALFTAKDTPTGTALIFVSQDGENCIAVAPGANHSLTCEAIDAVADRIAGAEYLLVQLEIPMETVACAIEKAYAAGTRVVLNPAPAMPLVDELLRKVYLITPNRTESETLTGIPVHTVQDASKAAGALLAKGVGNVIVTLGSEGALIRTRGGAADPGAHGHARRHDRRRRRLQRRPAGGALRRPQSGRRRAVRRTQRLGLGNPHGRTGLDTVARGAGDPRLNRTKTLKLKYYVRC